MHESIPSHLAAGATAAALATAFLKSAEGESAGPHSFSAPLGAATQGRLEFLRGAARVTLRVDPSMPELFRARFTGPAPEVQVQDGTVSVRYSLSFSDWLQLAVPWSQHGAEITLNGSIPWQLDFHGGVADISGDLSGLQLSALDVAGGASKLLLRLPRPSGIVPIHIRGGASEVTLHRPVGVAASVEVGGGASHLTFDEQRLGAVGGPSRLATTGLEDRPSRYEVHVHGGASQLTVDMR